MPVGRGFRPRLRDRTGNHDSGARAPASAAARNSPNTPQGLVVNRYQAMSLVPERVSLSYAPECDQPIRYIDRTRSWYSALGYAHPYLWAHYVDVPFVPLSKPLDQCLITFVTT